MRVLVVGTVPPPGGPAARRLAAVAAGRLAAGDEVTVLSPDARSAAHLTANLRGLGLAAQLSLRARRFDALELRIEPSLPFVPESNRALRAALLLALGAALGRYREVTLRLDSPVPIPGGVGGRATAALWRAVTTVVVENEEDRKLLLAVPGLGEERIELDEVAQSAAEHATSGWPAATEVSLRDVAQGEIRRRSRTEAGLRAARRELGAPADDAPSALSAEGRVRPSVQGLASAMVGISRQRALALARRQWAAIGAGSRSR